MEDSIHTKREFDVINLLIKGKKNKEIAELLKISVHTVKSHIEHIYDKHNVHSRLELFIKLSNNNAIIDFK